MGSLAERVNNAIVQIDFLCPKQPAGTKESVADMATHWIAFWDSAERKMLPPAAVHSKVVRYAQWYTRAFVLMPTTLQAKLTHPRQLDATFWAAMEDQLRQTSEGAAATGEAIQATGAFAARQLSELKKGLGELHGAVLKTVLIVGGVAIGIGLVVVLIKAAPLRA